MDVDDMNDLSQELRDPYAVNRSGLWLICQSRAPMIYGLRCYEQLKVMDDMNDSGFCA